MPDEHYDNPLLAELYDTQSGWSDDRDFYLSLAGPPPQAILDLGCGTGLLCNAYAERGHIVTGVDPSPGMLDVARRSPHAGGIEWVAATAETFRSDRRFDLVIMTGHAFQVLLNDRDIAAALATMRAHLKPNGVALFESRNPAIDWSRRWDSYEETFTFRGNPIHYRIGVVGWHRDRFTFTQTYTLPTGPLTSSSTLRFASRAEIETQIRDAGLEVESIAGDWHGGPFDPTASDEMIFRVRIA